MRTVPVGRVASGAVMTIVSPVVGGGLDGRVPDFLQEPRQRHTVQGDSGADVARVRIKSFGRLIKAKVCVHVTVPIRTS